MKMHRLTPKQRRLVKELDDMASLLRLNYREIRAYERESWTPRLEHIRRHFVRSEVILQYTLIDEFLNNILCRHFFGQRQTFVRLWKTKRFRDFNYFFIEKLSLMESWRSRDQAFFPENLRSAKPSWKGKNIFSLDGVSVFVEDIGKMTDFFISKLFAGNWASMTNSSTSISSP